jgi:hypothetical protein
MSGMNCISFGLLEAPGVLSCLLDEDAESFCIFRQKYYFSVEK